MSLDAAPDVRTAHSVVGRVAVLLGHEGVAGLPEALALLVEATSARSAVLRRAGGAGELLAGAGDVVRAVDPRPGPRRDTVELTVRGPHRLELAVLTVTGSRPADLPVLRSVGIVLGLVLAADVAPGPLAASAAALLLDAETDSDRLADALHDGPVQELVAARYAADAALRAGGDLALVRESVQGALVALRRTLWQLRPRGRDGLADALGALSERLVEGGAPALRLLLDPLPDAPPPAAALTAYRLVQALGLAAAAPLTVRLHPEHGPGGPAVVLLVDGAEGLPDADRWQRACSALGASLTVRPGRVRLVVPVPDPTPAAAPGSAPTTKAVR